MRSSSEPACKASYQLLAVPIATPRRLRKLGSSTFRVSTSRPEPQPRRQRKTGHAALLLLKAQPGFFWSCWRSSYEELRYGGRSRLADREEPREAVVRRRHQHHAKGAVSTSSASVLSAADLDLDPALAGLVALSVSTSTASVLSAADLDLAPALGGLVALRHESRQNEPSLPAGDWQHDGSTYTNHRKRDSGMPQLRPQPITRSIVQGFTATFL